MPQKRIALTQVNIGLRQQLQYQFLETTNRVCPEVSEDLKQVRRGLLPFDLFVEKCSIRCTWIEGAARSTLDAWNHNTKMEADSTWRLPSLVQDYLHGHPLFKETLPLIRDFHAPSYLSLRELWWNQLHVALKHDLDQIDRLAASQGHTEGKHIPRGLEIKMHCAALYLFRGWTVKDLVEKEVYATDPTNMWRRVRDVFNLLELPLRGRGKRARKNCNKPTCNLQ